MMSFSPRCSAATAALLAAVATLAPADARAQDLAQVSFEVVSGKVTNDSGRALPGAAVTITRGPDRLVKTDTTDSAGEFSVRFEPGTGDYLVAVSILGHRSARRRVQRQGGERELVANFTLASDATTLAAIKVQASRPVRARNNVNPFTPETGSSEKYRDGVEGQVSPSTAGDLGATAATIPGVTITPTGPSILGAGAESNLTTLNGMGMSAGAIPRAARTETRVTGATFDPTRGGFAGANIDVRLGPGDRFFQRRNAFITFDPPAFQLTDAVGRASGAPSGGFRGSLGADGELIRQALTYNVAVDVARAVSTPATLLDAESQTLLAAGVAPDSIARLLSVAQPFGVLSSAGIPEDRRRNSFTWLGRLDDTRDTLKTRALSSYFGDTRDGALNFGPLTAPSAGGERQERTMGLQLTLGDYVGPGRNTLLENRFAASRVTTKVSPYRDLPGATVLVRSPLADGDAASRDVSGIALGGSPFLFTDDARWTLEGASEAIMNARGSRHRFKALLWGRADGLTQEGTANRQGTFTFSSIDDFASGRPASFTRTLNQPDRSGRVWNAAAAFAHQFLPSRWFSTLYGVRIEGSGFLDDAPRIPGLESQLSVATGATPTRLHVSPRAGFTWTYNRDRENGSGTNQTPIGRFYRNMTGTLRGGIGEFRDLLRPNLIADASVAGGTSVLSCVGSAVPTADWASFAADPENIPTLCAGGEGPLAERAPALTLIDSDYDVPRSWRASLDWSTNVGKWLFRSSALASYDLNVPGTVDANFAGVPRFSLDPALEGGRPVFVSPGAIDPGSGAVSPTESRISTEWSRVGVRKSDLRGYGGQLTVAISPDVFKFRSRVPMFTSLSWTLQGTKRQYRGFDGAGFGDPRVKEWAPSANDARHMVLLTGGIMGQKFGVLTLFSRLQSGLPYTPIVQGDLNGDGRGGDRAFIPAVGAGDTTVLGSQIRSLLASGSESAKECLASNLGRVVARNSCRGPWTQSLNVQYAPRLPRNWQRRVRANIYLENVLGGIDQLVHGEENQKGWGAAATPDPVLLVPRGFDATANRFRYDVNQRFADTRPGRTFTRNPFRIAIDFSINLAVDFPLQQLRRAMEPVRGPENSWTQRGADSLAAFYLRRTSSVHKALLAESDSLFLSNSQIADLKRADSVYSARVRAIFVPLGRYLAGRRGHEPGKVELDSANAADKAYWKVFWEQPEIADSIVTPTQRELFPMLKGMVATPMADRENSRWQFGFPVTFDDRKPGAPSRGGGVQVYVP